MAGTVPESTRPGYERQDGWVRPGVELSAVGEGVRVCGWAEANGFGVDVGTGGVDGEQAVMKTSSVQSIAICFVA
jgi:hypothetical protein